MAAVIARTRLAMGEGISVLLEGQAGTGKSMLARAIHHDGGRREGPFVTVDCAALAAPELEIELFGAEQSGSGRLAQAHAGVLFLRNVEHLPSRLQARLLQALEVRAVARVGERRALPADCYLVAATEASLRAQVQRGRFRSDLYYRLDRLLLRLPPLRERSDIPELVARWMADRCPARLDLGVSEGVMTVFGAHPWPGNVRQMFNVLHASAVMVSAGESVIRRRHLPEDFWEDLDRAAPLHSALPGGMALESLETLESRAITEAVRAHGGNISSAARALGVSRATLYRKIRRA